MLQRQQTPLGPQGCLVLGGLYAAIFLSSLTVADHGGAPPHAAPPPLRKLSDTGLTPVMMRDILLKTVFRKNVEKTSEIAKAVCLPIPLTQELIDNLRELGLTEPIRQFIAADRPLLGICLGLQLLFTVAVMWLSAKVFRLGMLMYGKPPTPLELLKWVRYS